MSIINDALKKLQNQIGHTDISHLSRQEDTTPKNDLPASSAPVITEDSKESRAKEIPEAGKPAESHLVVVLVVLCLLTGLLLPVVNKQSLLVMSYQKAVLYFKQFQISRPAPPPVTARTTESEERITPAKVVSQPVATAPAPEPVRTPLASTPVAASPTVKKSPKPQSRLIINGIMTQGDKNVALIDGQIYEEGDTVDGIKLIKITAKGVTILEDGEERFVKVMGI